MNTKQILKALDSTLKEFEEDYAKKLYKSYEKVLDEGEPFFKEYNNSSLNSMKELDKAQDAFLIPIFGKRYRYDKAYQNSPHFLINRYTHFDRKKFNKWIRDYIKDQLTLMKGKLFETALNYVPQIPGIQKIEPLYVRAGAKGVEGTWKIYTNDDEIIFSVKAIYAGGYNIQRLHVRFKPDIKSLIKKVPYKHIFSQKRQQAADAGKAARTAEREKKQQDKKEQALLKKKVAAVKKLKDEFVGVMKDKVIQEKTGRSDSTLGYSQGIDSEIKELIPFWKEFYTGKVLSGDIKYYDGTTGKEISEKEAKKLANEHEFGWDIVYIVPSEGKIKSKYKRNELMEMAANGEIDELYQYAINNKWRL